ncbi:3-dehydroshikimate dehydratase [Didymella exigua CBS 183.55]|uniref:3-dehydroshikimate dehydratase n=1 Tax=Didymella exigua CBS 183.55 TaxID=1150837 RepID=A0A6A5RC72_9PLEO|nr:3-dehydroshikimate dehydratase [Didymella exigua CBS 183.55]KAF1924880.1 3-dehydroshikimate dehydratase [Didymella exigua CBS 183.55]
MVCRPGISSMSLGRCYAGHSFEHKMAMAAKYGLQGIEVFYEDLCDLAPSKSAPDLLTAAAYVRDLCDSLGLEIICLQPFMHYEGLLDRKKHDERVDEMKFWFELAHVLGTDIVQVPSSFLPKSEISSDLSLIVSDLQQIADMGLQQKPVIRFAYESLCWGTYCDKWERCWEIVQLVDRPNFGICLDSFNILGRIYADPTSETGCNEDAEEIVAASIKRLVAQIKPHREKIFFIQIVDAERLETPLKSGHAFYNAEQPSRMSWSRNCRLFYGETSYGAYLPVQDVANAIINEIGYDGWVSFELFNRAMERKEHAVVEELASRCAIGWEKMVVDLGLETAPPVLIKTASNEKFEDTRKDSTRTSFENARL